MYKERSSLQILIEKKSTYNRSTVPLYILNVPRPRCIFYT